MALTWPERVAVLIVIAGLLGVLGLSVVFVGGADSLARFVSSIAPLAAGLVFALSIYGGVLWMRHKAEVAVGLTRGGTSPSPVRPERRVRPFVRPFVLRRHAQIVPGTADGGGMPKRDRRIIRRLYAESGVSMGALAEMFGISKSTVHAIVHERERDARA